MPNQLLTTQSKVSE